MRRQYLYLMKFYKIDLMKYIFLLSYIDPKLIEEKYIEKQKIY